MMYRLVFIYTILLYKQNFVISIPDNNTSSLDNVNLNQNNNQEFELDTNFHLDKQDESENPQRLTEINDAHHVNQPKETLGKNPKKTEEEKSLRSEESESNGKVSKKTTYLKESYVDALAMVLILSILATVLVALLLVLSFGINYLCDKKSKRKYEKLLAL